MKIHLQMKTNNISKINQCNFKNSHGHKKNQTNFNFENFTHIHPKFIITHVRIFKKN